MYTQQQQAILDSIINEFKILNETKLSVNKCNYIDVSPIIEMKKRIQKEKEECKITFEASLNAYKPLVEEKFKLLTEDLYIVEELSCNITSEHQDVFLRIQKGIKYMIIYCTCWGKEITLSDNSTRATFDIEPKFYIRDQNNRIYSFKTFEELVKDSEFNNLLEYIIF